jgi:hypothetical protein
MKIVVTSPSMNMMMLDYPVSQQTLWKKACLQQLVLNFLMDSAKKFIPYSRRHYNSIQN